MRAFKNFLIAAALAAATAFAGPYDAWSKYRMVKVSTLDTTLGGAGVATSNTNYPLLVRLRSTSQATGSDVLNEAGANGASIRFTNAAGDTALAYEIDTWTATAATIWVKVPVVKGNDSTHVRLYWGRTGALTESSGPSVFDTANGYRSVWHMGNAAGVNPRPNSTHFAALTARPRNYATAGITPGVSTGAIGTADTLGGGAGGIDPSVENATTYFFIDSANATGKDTAAFMFPGGLFTVSYWVTSNNFTTNNRHFNMQASGLGTANPAGAIQTIPSSTAGNLYFRWSTEPAGTNSYTTVPTAASWPTVPAGRTIQSGGGLIVATDPALASRGGWQHVVGIVKRTQASVDSTRDSLIKIIDGQLILSTFGATGGTLRPLPGVRRPYVMLGRTFESATDGGHNGKLDEVQFLNRAVTRDWARLTFMTQRPDQSVVTLGATVVPGAPGQPTAATAVPANAGVVLSWTAPAVTGSFGAASSYTVTGTPSGSCTSFSTACLITGLTNGTGYTFTVTASNASGSGAASAASSSVTPVTTGPAAPGGQAAVPGNGLATVNWTAVGAATGGYRVFSNPGNYNCTQAAGNTSCAISGLTNGTAYTFSVLGNNGTVFGSASVTASVTPATLPGAPINPSATVNANASVTLTWTAPANNGGSAITGYTVTLDGAGSCPVTGAATTCTTTGLTLGNPYTFNISAVNSVGTGPFVQTQALAVARPATPAAPAASAFSSGLTSVSWTAPAANGSAITGYTVFRSGLATPFCTATTLTNCSATITVSGSYTFRVTATNAIGTSDTSAASAPLSVTGLAGGVAKGSFGFEGANTFRVSPVVVSELEKVTIRVTDAKGHLLWNKSVYPARDGVREISWNAEQGFDASAGVYTVHAEVTALDGQVQSLTRKSTMMKP